MSSPSESKTEVRPQPSDPYYPHENAGGRLWRYMHLPKFIAMLTRKGLYHVRADRLGDPYEGLFTDGFLNALAESDARGPHPELFKKVAEGAKSLRELCYVCAWCMHEHESKSMWDRYAKDPGGVCVESTVSALRECLPAEVIVGRVNYIDYASIENAPFLTLYDYVLHKRHSFMDEREVRSIIKRERLDERGFLYPTGELGVWQPVDLNALVKRVWVGPGSEEWVFDMVKDLVTRYGFSFPVEKSELLNTPLGTSSAPVV